MRRVRCVESGTTQAEQSPEYRIFCRKRPTDLTLSPPIKYQHHSLHVHSRISDIVREYDQQHTFSHLTLKTMGWGGGNITGEQRYFNTQNLLNFNSNRHIQSLTTRANFRTDRCSQDIARANREQLPRTRSSLRHRDLLRVLHVLFAWACGRKRGVEECEAAIETKMARGCKIVGDRGCQTEKLPGGD